MVRSVYLFSMSPLPSCLLAWSHDPCMLVCTSNCLSAGSPPSVFISKEESVALEGEKFEVTCLSINPTYLSHLTWTHSKKRVRGYAHVCVCICMRVNMGICD